MIERLWIENNYIPLSKSINASLTKSITDIQEPDKRKATYSKTARIPNSKEASKVFGHIFEINLVNGSFNPGVKADVRYEVNGEVILEGYLQLKKIIQLDNKDLEYDVVMFGTVANIFSDMGEEYLTDLSAELDQWNHPFTPEVQEKSWATEVWDNDASAFTPFALGTGYVYPLADYGIVTNLDKFRFDQIPCALYAHEYVNAIFDKHGYTYNSTFFDSTYFKSLIIPGSPTSYQLDSADITAQQFTANTPNFVSTGTSTSAAINPGNTFTAVDTIKFTVEGTDPSGLHDTTTGQYTIISATYEGTYDINALIDVNATFTPSTGAAVACVSNIQGALYVYVNGNQITGIPFYITYGDYPNASYTTGARSTDTAPTPPSARIDYLDSTSDLYYLAAAPGGVNLVERYGVNGVPDRYHLALNNYYLNNGDVVTIRWKARFLGTNFDPTKCFIESGGTYHTGTANVIMSVGSFYNKSINQTLAEGATLEIEKTIPKNVKQKDFFMSLVKMFNLWIDTDPDDPKTYNIEPRDDFLGTDIVEIQEKLAQDKELEIIPMGKLDAAEYYFTYKQDKDHLNQKYEGDHHRVYGDRYINNTNEFVINQKKTEVIFSPTPNSAPPNKTRVMPTIIQLDDLGQPKSTDHNIRIWYYGGLKNGEAWEHWGGGAYSLYNTNSTYPYAGHVDDPFTWTEDLNFGLVNEVYYDDNVTTITVTDNNLVNKYYSEMIQTYTATNSKIATGWFNVNPRDFKTWSFDKLYHFENAFWRLQKIENFNPTGETLTKCTFLFLDSVPAFSSSSYGADGGQDVKDPGLNGGDGDFTETMPTKGTKTNYTNDFNNYPKRGIEILGESNLVNADAEFVKINGDSNTVNGGSKDVVINGDNNIIDLGASNVALINTNGVTVTESNVTYIDGKLQGDGSWETKTASFTVDQTKKGYFIDTVGADITAGLDSGATNDQSEWIFKRLGDNPGDKVTISSAIYPVDGDANGFKLNAWESIRVKWNNDEQEYNIIN